jgi:gliding motility-associated-like protein
MRRMHRFVVAAILVLAGFVANAQYVVNGTAAQLSCNCYRLTQAINTQSGSVWNENQISLEDSFDFSFDIYLGTNDEGADGIAFVLQPISTSIGSSGGGLGYQNITPSLAVEIDTYFNTWDPGYDHVAIMANGDVDHSTPNNLAGPAPALFLNDNIENGQDHLLRVFWDPLTQTMQVYVDGLLRTEYTGNVVSNIFADDPNVFWGFTGSTGGLNNEQRFCLAVLPGMEVSSPQICAGDSVQVIDSSYSALGAVVAWAWDFGNGQVSQLRDPGFITYDQPGDYYIVQSVVDAAGCGATDSLMLRVVPDPMAEFTAQDVCFGDSTYFIDLSTTGYAQDTIVQWSWELGAYAATSNVQNPVHLYPLTGTLDVILHVATSNGCTATGTAQVNVNQLPVAEVMHSSDGLDATFGTALEDGETAQWFLADSIVLDASFNLTFPDSGWYNVQLVITNQAGCSDTLWYDFYLEGFPDFTVSNVFTPNGDAVNDVFEPYTYGITEASIKVFNRWGRPVHSFDGTIVPGTMWGWDGNINGGAEAASGTYYFMVDLLGMDGNRFKRNGAVTLIR